MHSDLQNNIDITVVLKIDVLMLIRCFTSGYHNQQLLWGGVENEREGNVIYVILIFSGFS